MFLAGFFVRWPVMEHLMAQQLSYAVNMRDDVDRQLRGCHQPHPLRLISFQDAEPAVTFEGSQLDVFVALDTLFS